MDYWAAFSLSPDIHNDLDCRGTSLQGARHSQQDAYDSLSSTESGLSLQESKLRYFNLSYQTGVTIFIGLFNYFFKISEWHIYTIV